MVQKVSLEVFSSLIGLRLVDSQCQEKELHRLMHQLHAGDFSCLPQFEEVVDKLLNDILESVKAFAQKDEEQKVEILQEMISTFLMSHLLDKKTASHIRHEFEQDLAVLIRNIRKETCEEEQLVHDKRPIAWILKNKLFPTSALHISSEEIALEESEKRLYEEINSLDVTSSELKDKLLKLGGLLLREFQAILDMAVGVELEESDLIHEISVLMKTAPTDAQPTLHKIKEKIQRHLRQDIQQEKTLYSRIKGVQDNMGNL
ncbi:MAG: hypothetical protein ACQESG_03850 [Nanobdellota archaeon]